MSQTISSLSLLPHESQRPFQDVSIPRLSCLILMRRSFLQEWGLASRFASQKSALVLPMRDVHVKRSNHETGPFSESEPRYLVNWQRTGWQRKALHTPWIHHIEDENFERGLRERVMPDFSPQVPYKNRPRAISVNLGSYVSSSRCETAYSSNCNKRHI